MPPIRMETPYTYHLVSGEGDGNNSLFTLDQNGTLKTAAVLDYEAGSSLTIRVQARDEYNATKEGNFTVTLVDVDENPKIINLGKSNISIAMNSGEIDFNHILNRNYGGSLGETLTNAFYVENSGYVLSGMYNSAQGTDYFVLLIDFNGTKVWEKTFVGNLSDRCTSSVLTQDGNIVLAGYSNSNSGGTKSSNRKSSYDFDDFWIIKIDLNGNLLWEKTYGSNGDDECYSIVEADNGDFLLAGISFGSGFDKSSTSFGNYDYWLMRLDSSGNKIWDKTYGGSGEDECYDLVKLPNDFYVLVGESHSTISGNKTSARIGGSDFWVVKVNGNGTKVWDKAYGAISDDYGKTIAVNEAGDLYLGGYSGLGNYGNPSGDRTEKSNGGWDFWVIKTNSNGEIEWEKTIGGTGDDRCYDIVCLDNNLILAVGGTSSLRDGNITLDGYGDYDAMVFYLSGSGEILEQKRFGTESSDVFSSASEITNGRTIYAGTFAGDFKIVSEQKQVYAFDPEGRSLSWSLSKLPFNGVVEINGQGSFPSKFTYKPNDGFWGEDNFTISVSNGVGHAEYSFSAHVTFQNTPPIDFNFTAPLTIAENQPIGTIVGEFTATDPDGHELSFRFLDGDNNNSLFSLETNGTLRSATAFDFESNASTYNIELSVADSAGESISGTFSVGLLDVFENSPPIELRPVGELSVMENQPAGTVVGALVAADPDGHVLSFRLAGRENNNSSFTLDINGILRTAEIFDFEEARDYFIGVEVTDEMNASIADSFMVLVLNDAGDDPIPNRKPVDLKVVQPLQVLENQPVGTPVGVIAASDPDGDSLIYRFVGSENNNSLFSLDLNGTLSSSVIFDFENNATTYQVEVEVSDRRDGNASAVFNISLLDLNEAPVGLRSLAALTLSENQPTGTAVGQFTASDPDGDALSFHLLDSGTNSNGFQLDPDGTLRAVKVFNFENQSSHTVLVVVRDDQNASTQANFDIAVTDTNDAPVITFPDEINANVSIPENQTLVTTVVASDEDAGTQITFSVDNANFDIDPESGALAFAPAPDFENPTDENGDNQYHAKVMASDGEAAAEQAITVTVTDVNELPFDLNNTAPLTLQENAPVGTLVGQFTASDPDGDALTFQFVSGDNDNLLFALETNGTLRSATIFDFETNASNYLIVVQARDESNATAENQFSITLLDLDDEKPVILLNGDENVTHEAGSLYQDANARWTDNVDGVGNVFGVGEVNASILGIYTITYSFTDSSGNEATSVTRTVTVVDTIPPVITMFGDENTTHLAGLEYTEQGAVWHDLVDGSGTADIFGTVVVNVPGTYEVTYFAMDAAGNSALPVVRKVNVIDTQAPVITLLGFSNHTHEAGSVYSDAGAVWTDLVDGNGTVDTAGTVDENVPGTYTITYRFTDSSGNEATSVTRTVTVVDTTHPVITLIGDTNISHNVGVDYFDQGAVWTDLVDGNGIADANGSVDENIPGIYEIIYTFTDSSGNQATPVFRAIEVVNKSPNDLNSTVDLHVGENQPIGSHVGEFNAIDPDGEEIVFSLVGGTGATDNSLFNLDPNGTLTTTIVFDFEESSNRSIRVQANDPHGASISNVFIVVVDDEDEEVGKNPPVNLRTLSPLSVAENQQAGILVGSFNASDPDGDELIFSLVEGEGDMDNPKFELSNNGVLNTLQTFNFEDQEIQKIRVAVGDQHGGKISKSFEVLIIDQNDFPTSLVTSGSLSIQENQPFGTLVGLFSAFDEDGDKLTFSLAPGPGDRGNESFTITEDGMLLTATSFDFEEVNVQTIRVSALDGKGGSVSASFEVIILDQFENNAPIDLNTTGMPSVAENREAGTLVTIFNALDRDGDELKFSLVGGVGDTDNLLFTLDENGTLNTAVMFDFEEAETRSIRVQVMDIHGESITESFTIQIIDHENESIILEASEFISNGIAGEIGKLKVLGRSDVTFGLGQDERGAMHMFLIEDDGTLMLAENARENGTFNLTVLISKDEELLDKQPVTVQLTIDEPENFMEADTSDSTYHETALMIRDLAVVQDDWRNGHNPITAIENKVDGLFVTTAQPHGRKEKDSVVLSGVRGLLVDGIENWNFMIDEVGTTSFRLRRFGKDADGLYDGSLGRVVRAVDGTAYQSSPSDFLLGPWTFGHLLGNMVSEQDDPSTFTATLPISGKMSRL